jgi:phosphoglycerol transferase MdoB-like AlkP superfamily enzyme
VKRGALGTKDAVQKTRGLAPWVSAAPSVLIWLPAALAVLYLKYALMMGGGFKIATRHLGIFDNTDLSLGDKVSFFRGDVLVCCFVVPLALLVLARLLPRVWRSLTIAVLCVACILLAYLNTLSVYSVGRLLSGSLLLSSFHWGLADTWSIWKYLRPGGLMRLGALLLFLILTSWWSTRQSNAIEKSPSLERLWRQILVVGLAGSIVITAIPWIPLVPSTTYHESILIESIRTLLGIGTEPTGTSEFSTLGASQLLAQYREWTHAPSPEKDPRYWGKAAGSDVIVVILETGPAAILDITGDLDDMPVLRRLRERSFVASRHYSTYPYTSRAHFSIFSSWYPSNRTVDFILRYPDLVVPGVMRILAAAGYETVAYMPHPAWSEPDQEMYQALGFQRQVVAHPITSDNVFRVNRLAAWTLMRSFDSDTLSLIEKDMEDWLGRDHRFAVAFVPQQGHGPWPDVSADEHLTSIAARGRAIMAMQDAYLGELVELLEKHHRLERTIIVVTADHGIRTRVEDPSLQGGMIDDYSFHVPLLIYAPQVLQSAQNVAWITSHIDIQPTVLDLLGIGRGRDFEQGSAIWDSRLAQRTTFFFANHYLGADGYYSDGQFFMWSSVSDSVYQNDRLHFATSQMVAGGTPTYHRVTETIGRMAALQQRWVAVLGQTKR